MCACGGQAWMSQKTAQELCMSAVGQSKAGCEASRGKDGGTTQTLCALWSLLGTGFLVKDPGPFWILNLNWWMVWKLELYWRGMEKKLLGSPPNTLQPLERLCLVGSSPTKNSCFCCIRIFDNCIWRWTPIKQKKTNLPSVDVEYLSEQSVFVGR